MTYLFESMKPTAVYNPAPSPLTIREDKTINLANLKYPRLGKKKNCEMKKF